MSPTRIDLRERRLAKGLSQEQLARLAGISRVMIIRIENGQTAGIRLGTLDRLATALEVHPGALFVREDAPAKPKRRKRGSA